MHHFAYRDGVLHAEAVNLASLAQAVGTPFYCYSTATLERHYRVFAERLRRRAVADLLRDQGQLQPGGDRDAWRGSAPAPTWCRKASSSARVPPALPPEKIMFSGIGKTARELARAVDEGIFCVNVESEAELALLSSIAAGKGRTMNVSLRVNPDVDAHDAREDRDRQGREQVRHSDQPRARGLRRGRQAAGPEGRGRRHAYRQPDHRSRAIRDAFSAARRLRAGAARRRPPDRPCRSRRRPRHSLSRGQRAAARPAGLCARWSSARCAGSTAS